MTRRRCSYVPMLPDCDFGTWGSHPAKARTYQGDGTEVQAQASDRRRLNVPAERIPLHATDLRPAAAGKGRPSNSQAQALAPGGLVLANGSLTLSFWRDLETFGPASFLSIHRRFA